MKIPILVICATRGQAVLAAVGIEFQWECHWLKSNIQEV